jgi:hypothetical protein
MQITERIAQVRYEINDLCYEPPQSIGRVRVHRVISSSYETTDEVELDIKKGAYNDDSGIVFQVPRGWFETSHFAELIIQLNRGLVFLATPTERVNAEVGPFCRIAIRPYQASTYGKEIDSNDPQFRLMFSNNTRNPLDSPGFYRKYLAQTYDQYWESVPWMWR